VDGTQASIGQRADPAAADIRIDGIPLPVAPDLAYYLAYKPAGVVSTASDPEGRPTVLGLAPAAPRVFPVGRLDADTEGLIVLTNDGDLTLRLTHPRYGVHKTYVALVQGTVEPATIRTLVEGIVLEDGPAKAERAKVIDHSTNRTIVEVVMSEGRNRIVRRLLEDVGHPVLHLTRTAIGPLRDPNLSPGTSRPLTVDEVRALYAAAGDRDDGA
jgi:23S rRNA pseudouridine2605 synthase